MTTKNIEVQVINSTLLITICRESKLNALNRQTLDELEKEVDIAQKDNNIKGVILTGAGRKAFIAGADIKEFANYTPEEGYEMVHNGQTVLSKIENSSKPFIAAVNGHALGGGCEIAMACHLRIASNNAQFGQPEAGLGIIPGYGGTQRLIQLIGKSRALELMMTCDTIDAVTAEKYGLVNFLCNQDNLIDTCFEVLNRIYSKSPFSISRIIKSANAYFASPDGYKVERDEFKKCVANKDFQEGTSAFIEKRSAKFS